MTLLEYYLQHEIIKVCLCTNARQNTKEDIFNHEKCPFGGITYKTISMH